MPDGLEVELCTEPNAGGHCLWLRDDAAWLTADLAPAEPTTESAAVPGFDDRISSVEWHTFDSQRFSLLAFDGDSSSGRTARAALAEHGAAMGEQLAGVVVDVPTTSLGTSDSWRRFDDRFVRDTGLHMWLGWRQTASPSSAHCFDRACGLAAFTFIEHAVASHQPLRLDATIEQEHGVLQRGRSYRGSLAYSWVVGEYRFIQLHQGMGTEHRYSRWNPTLALTERLQLDSAQSWLVDELALARQHSESAFVFVGELDSTLIDIVTRNPDVVAAVVVRDPAHDEVAGVPIRSRGLPPGAMFLQLDFEPHRITAYGIGRAGDTDTDVDLWHIDVPLGYRPLPGAAINQHNLRTLKDQTKGQCAVACDTATDFECRSFDYNLGTKTCHLASIDSTAPAMTWNRPAWVLYERVPPPKDFTVRSDAAIVGHNTRTLFNHTPSQCLQACRDERDFVCRSVDYHRSETYCYLSDVSGDEVEIKPRYLGYDHFARTGLDAQPRQPVR